MMYWARGNYYIEYNLYGRGEYSVQVCGDDILFDTLNEAEMYVDELNEADDRTIFSEKTC